MNRSLLAVAEGPSVVTRAVDARIARVPEARVHQLRQGVWLIADGLGRGTDWWQREVRVVATSVVVVLEVSVVDWSAYATADNHDALHAWSSRQ